MSQTPDEVLTANAMPGTSGSGGPLNRIFKLQQNGTTVTREVIAGLTTFAAMAYILVVNPSILKAAGMPQAALVTATAVGAAIATILMGLMANFPLALAPGMGINAFFAFTVCLGMGIPWQSALGLVFVNGCIFLILSVTGVREQIVNALPNSLKAAVSAGVGLFIAFIGLKNGGLVVASPATFVTMGDLATPSVALFGIGLLITCILVARRTPAAIIISMVIITAIGLFVPDGNGGTVTHLPTAFVSLPASIEPTFLKLNFTFLFTEPLKALPVILTLLLVDMFDNIGTLIGVTKRAGLMDANGRLPGLPRALMADSIAAILSSLLGTSTVVSYIESAAGVQAGGRTGLTSITVAICFILALVFTPVILMIPVVAVAPALVVVGILMFEIVSEIDLTRFEVCAPAILTLMAMPMTFSISTGIGLGLIMLAAVTLGTGKRKKKRVATGEAGAVVNREFEEEEPVNGSALTPFTYALAIIFLLHFFERLLLPH
ncbi:MAG TPA: NCS2 family permease [Chthoniobacterales bacterium]|nr:NCS2 family permease [Chthoniobacterales bacterium]